MKGRASPKSASLTPRPPSTRKLRLLTSQCMTPLAWRKATPAAHCRHMRARRDMGRRKWDKADESWAAEAEAEVEAEAESGRGKLRP